MLGFAGNRCARAKREIDDEIRRVLRSVACQHQQRHYLQKLITHVQDVSDLLRPTCATGHASCERPQRYLTGLLNLSKFYRSFQKDVYDWQPVGTTKKNYSPRQEFGRLARHLFGGRNVPPFMDYVWWDANRGTAVTYQKWYRHLAAGFSIRGLHISELSTEGIATRFLQAPDHLTVEGAIHWSHRPAEVKRSSVYPCSASRRRRKQATAWESCSQRAIWRRIGVADFHYDDDGSLANPRHWIIRQIREPRFLVEEGNAMDHCVASYVDLCEKGQTSIWSMRSMTAGRSTRVLTIEVDPRHRRIVEALGHKNRAPRPHERRVFTRWARRERLTIAGWV